MDHVALKIKTTCFIICYLTHQPAVISAIVEEQLLVRVDLCCGTEEQFPVGRVCHQVLLLTGPEHITHATDRSGKNEIK